MRKNPRGHTYTLKEKKRKKVIPKRSKPSPSPDSRHDHQETCQSPPHTPTLNLPRQQQAVLARVVFRPDRKIFVLARVAFFGEDGDGVADLEGEEGEVAVECECVRGE